MKTTLYGLTGLAVTCVLFGLVASPALAQVDGMLSSDEPTLSEGLATTIALVNSTMETYPSTKLAPEPDGADPTQAGDLENNYSLSDHSDSRTYPGYNDCDSWRNLIHDGWSATYEIRSPISRGQDDELLVAVRHYWESQGYVVQTLTHDQSPTDYSRMYIDLEFTQIQLNVDPRREEVTIRGTTACLPPG